MRQISLTDYFCKGLWLILQTKFKLRRGGIEKGRLTNPRIRFSDDLLCVDALFEHLFLALQNGGEESVGLVFHRIEAQVFAGV